jgi:TRAP-type C4-dicarboxylate transport system permease small subunit
MKPIISALETISRAAAGIVFLGLIAAVLAQALGRTVLVSSPVWTEELTRYALAFLGAFGIGPSLPSGDLVNGYLVCEARPGDRPRRLRILCAVITAGPCGALIGPAWNYTSIGAMQTPPALGWISSMSAFWRRSGP